MPDRRSFKVLAVGNNYVPSSLLLDGLLRYAEPAGIALDTQTVTLPYPPIDPAPLPEVQDDRIRGYWEANEGLLARLKDDAADPALVEYTGPVDGLVDEMEDVEILICHNAPLSRNAIAAASLLRVVGSIRTVPGNINVNELTKRKIPLFTTPSRNAHSVAELIVGSLLAHMRGIVTSSKSLQDGYWNYDAWRWESAGSQLHGKTFGLIGLGKVGSALAPIARGLGLELLVHDPHVDRETVEEVAGRPPVDLGVLLEVSDIIVMCARLSDRNVHLIDAAAFRKMKQSAVLVNTARAGLIDYDALRSALLERTLAGAVLDVYDPEPLLSDDPLLRMPNVLLTPHIAGATKETVQDGADLLGKSIVSHLVDGTFDNCHNREAISRT